MVRGDRGSLGLKIHFTAYFYYELAIWNTQYTCLYLYIIPIFEALKCLWILNIFVDIYTLISRKKVFQCTPVWGASGQHMGFFGTQLGYPFLNIKWRHIQHYKSQHVKIFTLNDFTLQSKQKTFLNRQ